MPFSGPSSYLSTIDEFFAHWTDVDADLGGAGPLELLPGPYGTNELQTDRDDLAGQIGILVAAINVVEGHRTNRDNQKEAVRERMKQLGGYIRGTLSATDFVGKVPELIAMDANPGKWLISMRDHRDIWTDINANSPAIPGFVPPLLLHGGFTLANFVTATGTLENTLQEWTMSGQVVDDELKRRDDIYLAVRDRLIAYREAVPGRFPSDHPLVLSLPRLTPLPGHTPDPVILAAVWNPGTVKADLSWGASTDPDLDFYRICRSGPPYNVNTEVVVGTVPAGTLTFSTDAGLTSPGSSEAFKVYVVLNTSNEAGSNAVTVNRP